MHTLQLDFKHHLQSLRFAKSHIQNSIIDKNSKLIPIKKVYVHSNAKCKTPPNYNVAPLSSFIKEKNSSSVR